MQRNRRDGAVLGQRNRRFAGDARARRCAIDDENQRLAVTLGDVDSRADRAQIMRAGPRRYHDEIGMRHNLRNRIGDGGRRIDDGKLDAATPQFLQRFAQLQQADFRKVRRARGARVPPVRQAPLRIGIDQRNRTDVRLVGFHRQMAR